MAFRDLDIHVLVGMYARETAVAVAYTELSIEAPEALATEIADLKRIIADKNRDAKILKIRRIETSLIGLMSASERRSELEAELKRLQAETAK